MTRDAQIGWIPNEDEELSIVSDTTEDDSRDKNFDIGDLSSSSSNASRDETISDNEIDCLKSSNLTGDQCKTFKVISQPLSEKIVVGTFFLDQSIPYTHFCFAGKKSS